MAIPTIFTQQGGEAVASYSWLDLVQGVGYKTFYLLDSYESTNIVYSISPESSISADIGYSQSGSNSALSKDFDIPITKMLVVKGNVLINAPFNITRVTGTGGGGTTISAKLYRVRGGTPTQIGSTASKTISYADLGTSYSDHWNMFSCRIAVSSTTIFKQGDTLRLTIDTTAGGSNVQTKIYHDPTQLNVTTGITSTKALLNIPLKIDL
jgi:hypothetical protein